MKLVSLPFSSHLSGTMNTEMSLIKMGTLEERAFS